MQITIDTNNLSEMDVAMLAFLAGQAEETPADEEPEAPAPAKTPAKKAPAKAAAKAPEPEDEDLVGGDGPTMADAVAAATKLVSSGGSAKVKEALAAVEAKRVSEITEDKIADFLAALES